MKIRKIATALVLMGLAGTAYAAKPIEELRIYINPGHGSWTGNDRPMQVIGKGEYSATNTDTTGFFETNTNLLKGFGMLETLIEMGMPFDRTLNQTGERWEIGAARDLSQNIVMSRVKNGPFEANNTTSSPNYMLYNRALLEIATEVEHNEFDQFVSIHSNAASEGTSTNYHLFMYRGRNGKENVWAPGSWEMAEASWKYTFDNPHAGWSTKSVYINGDVDFMGGKDYVPKENELGYAGYLGVMKHGVPGYLCEGYFHTYQPARHRGMNFDVDFVEGIQHARGVAEYWQFENRGTKGEIYGIVRDVHERFRHKLYNPNPSTDDLYKPLNGVTAILWKGDTKVAEYTTDQFYNGAFVFLGLEPGDYTITLSSDEYKSLDEPLAVTVKAGVTSYPKAYLEAVGYEPPKEVFSNYPDPYAGNAAVSPAAEYVVAADYVDEAIQGLEGKVIRRAIVREGKMYILALDKNIEFAASVPVEKQPKPTIIVYDLAKKAILATVSTEGAAGNIAAINDIQVTADGYLLACNATKNHDSDAQIQDGDAGRGTFYIYKWDNDEAGLPTGNPVAWMKTQTAGLWYRSYPNRFVFSGTTTDGTAVALQPTVTGPAYNIRSTTMRVIDGEIQAVQDNQTGEPRVPQGETDASMNLVASPFDADNGLLIDPNKGVIEWNLGGHLQNLPAANELLKGIDGRSGIFSYAGTSYLVAPATDGTNVTGLKLINLGKNVEAAVEATLTVPAELAPVATTEAAAAGEVEVVRDEVSGDVKSGWINFYLLRDGKLTRYTTKNVEQPQGRREYAYGLAGETDNDTYTITYSLTGDVPEVNLVFTPQEGGEAITVAVGAGVKGENTYTLDKSQLEEGLKYNWAVEVVSDPIAQAGKVYSESAGLTVRGGVITITDPEQASYGYTAVGHGNNQGIDIYNPAGEKVATRVFKSHTLFGGENGSNGNSNQSNPFRGHERLGYAVFSTWGDAGHGMVAINPADPTEEPFSLFAGTKQGGGHFLYNGVNLGGGNAGFDFIGKGDDTYVISFSEDHEGLNGKGATENSLVKYHLGSGWQITEAPVVLGYKNLLANQNVDIATYGDGVFAVQIREAGNNIQGTPAFAYIANILTEPTIALQSSEEGIADAVQHSTAGIAVSTDGSLLAVSYRNAIGIFNVTWADGKPTVTPAYTFPVADHIWANLEFDAASNLHAYLRGVGYNVYSLPAARPTATTAAKAEYVVETNTGVVEISAAEAAEADAVFYNLQGVRVDAASLVPGIYVKVAGASATKVIVK